MNSHVQPLKQRSTVYDDVPRYIHRRKLKPGFQSLAFLAVFVYATHATQAIATEWKPGFREYSGQGSGYSPSDNSPFLHGGHVPPNNFIGSNASTN